MSRYDGREKSYKAGYSGRTRARRGVPWRGLFLFGFLALLLAAWFAPTIVLSTSLRDRVLRSALADFPGKVTLGSASAGWLSPVVIKSAAILDQNGQEVLTAAAIRSEKNLFSLALDASQLGKITLDQPKLKLVVRPDGSNLEDLLQPLLAKPKSAGATGLTVEIVNGIVEAKQAGTEPVWTLNELNAKVTVQSDFSQPLFAQLTTQVNTPGANPADARTGKLAADLEWQPGPAASGSTGKGKAKIQTTGLPLNAVSLAMVRAGLDFQLSGFINLDASVGLDGPAQSAKITQLDVDQLFLAAPSVLGTDQIQLAKLTGGGEIALTSTGLQFRDVKFASDIATLAAQGSASSATGPVATNLVDALRTGSFELRGDIDLAKLAAMLPNTLRLREGTHFSSGQMTIALVSQQEPSGHVWNADVNASQLAAIYAGTSYEWKKPITVKAAVREAPAGIVVEQLACDSSFFQLAGNGTIEQGQVQVDGDLSQFVGEFGRFLDLGSLKAAGKFAGNVHWKNTNGTVGLSGRASTQQFELTYAADRPWQESKLDVDFTADAKFAAGGKLAGLDAGQLIVVAAGDRLVADLRQPMAFQDVTATTAWPLHVKMNGDLNRWLARMQMFFTLDGWQFGGDIESLEGDLLASTQRLVFTDTKGKVRNLAATGAGLSVREPALQVDSTGAYDVAKGELTSPMTTIAGSAIAARAEHVRVLLSEQVALEGDVTYRTNLERLVMWLRDANQPVTYRVAGEAVGSLKMSYADGATTADMTATIDKFAYSTPPTQLAGLVIKPANQAAAWQELWKEPKLEIALQGSLNASGELATIDKLQVAGEALSLGAAGSIRDPMSTCQLDLSGQYAYDLERLSQRLRGMLGPQVQMSGTAQRPFTFKGPIFAAIAAANPESAIRAASTKPGTGSSFANLTAMSAEAGVAWEKLSVQGFEIGEGEVNTKLDRGILTIQPISLPVSEGKITVAPRVDVTQTPYMATLEPGVVVDQVRISPQMCRSWLKYLAPLVADATAAEGSFSVALDDAKFPVSDPTGGNLQGQLIVHAAQIGPGPLTQEIILLAQQIKAILDKQPAAVDPQSRRQWLDIPKQQLNFQLADHRVYHRDMIMTVQDISIKTSGWVGLDQQLALVAEVPVRDEWVAKDRYLASLKGQMIRLPVTGTLTRPQIDRNALRQLTKQTVINAGSNILQDELNKGLNRLFQPKNPPMPQPVPPP